MKSDTNWTIRMHIRVCATCNLFMDYWRDTSNPIRPFYKQKNHLEICLPIQRMEIGLKSNSNCTAHVVDLAIRWYRVSYIDSISIFISTERRCSLFTPIRLQFIQIRQAILGQTNTCDKWNPPKGLERHITNNSNRDLIRK